MPEAFHDFADIENDVASKVPPIVYKYREWSNTYHQALLKENIIWLSHPKDLNDPYDIRIPVRFDYSEIESPLFYEAVQYQTALRFPELPVDSRDFLTVCENKMNLIKENPKKHFEDNYLKLRESDLFDRIGVLSLTGDCENETMWAHYGKNATGFSVGFNTVELAKQRRIGFGLVDYSDEPPFYSFIKEQSKEWENQMYIKHTKWTYEKEFRLVTCRISSDNDRSLKFDKKIISEIVLGNAISEKDKDEIIRVLKTSYQSSVRLFICKPNASSFGLHKEEISY